MTKRHVVLRRQVELAGPLAGALADVVEQHVDAPEPPPGGRQRLLHGVGIGPVRRDRQRRPPAASMARAASCKGSALTIDHDEIGALARQAQRAGAADAVGGAGNDARSGRRAGPRRQTPWRCPFPRDEPVKADPALGGGEAEAGDDDQHGRDGGDGGIHPVLDRGEDLHRQGHLARAQQEDRDRDVVERHDEREQRAGRDSGAHERQRDGEERDRPARAQDAGGALQLRIDALQARHHRPHDVGHGDHHVGEGQPDQRPVHVHQRVELQQRDAHHHAREDQGRVQQGGDEGAARARDAGSARRTPPRRRRASRASRPARAPG